MKKSLSNQSGMSFFGLSLVLGFIGIVTLFTLRAFPLYSQKFAVISSMNTVASKAESSEANPRKIAELLYRNFTINNVSVISARDLKKHMKIIKNKDGSPPTLKVFYEMDNVLFQDLFLKMNFEHEVILRGP